VDGIPKDDGNEFDFFSEVSTEEVTALESFDLAQSGKQLGLQHGFIVVSVVVCGISVPNSSDHLGLQGDCANNPRRFDADGAVQVAR
jgi:hypothetical protein